MSTSAGVLEMLEAQSSSSPVARRTSETLRREHMKPVADKPSSITVSEALRLWRTRLLNIPHTKQPIEGITELIEELELLAPQRKVNQYGFVGKGSAAAVFFSRQEGTFLGSAIVTGRRK
jgi:hypothetical protein